MGLYLSLFFLNRWKFFDKRFSRIPSKFSVGFDATKDVTFEEMSFKGDLESRVSARKCKLIQNFKV